ncbi:tRNA 2-thiouridine synthesizing protein E [Arcanobacterium wilhelmae]|uniref:tRNA 2-thiouridine synthesizing protein E n=1 Tax=Arcanobacterium wilhelmae TaxID=1803177 RepID=A0ABT9NAJ3_9ACTO|nr:TusE/DsrC/DsvC family sulfur relay protein [Arcanobacterium wilhelmae]MDP9800416.1 tRNA 2-thiouridine synthesizing protein E [Arcanobacterium wilhelmae]WFN89842.1 TusE/DsrC/DsvC family sulfur relay protein [Arcanobacterium wilhelmae]
MPTNTLGKYSFEVDSEGFFTVSSEWSEDLAREMATLVEIELTDEHLAALNFMRKDAAETGATPTLRRMQSVGGFKIKELYQLFPGKTLKMMAWLSGLRKPVSCV